MPTTYDDLALAWRLDRARGPLSAQLVEHMREAIRDGTLVPGDRIPATRKLSCALGIARGTVTTAIELLIAEGVLHTRQGAGTFVAPDAALLRTQRARARRPMVQLPQVALRPDIDERDAPQIDLRPCRPSLEAFPRSVWRRCLARAGDALPLPDYGDPRGDVRLREVIAEYLRRARGVTFEPEEIMITNGAVHAMHLVASVYLDARSSVLVEDPGYPLARQTFALAGARIVPCPVDAQGLQVDRLPKRARSVRLVYVTPSHQFPTGSRLSFGRRQALIDWAHEHDALIIEDDYAGEFRYDVPPLPPMAAMTNGCVVYCGTFSKTLFPGLRMGFAAAPARIVDALANYRIVSEYGPNTIVQSALSRFIAEGHYERHIHRMRRIYRAKRKALSDTLLGLAADAQLLGLDSGLSGFVRLGPEVLAREVCDWAQTQGVAVPPMSRYALEADNAQNGLVIGYAAESIEKIIQGVGILAQRM